VTLVAPARSGRTEPDSPAPWRRRPGTALLVALLATVNAFAWGLIVAPFHVPDEPSHAFYAQYFGETGKLPKASANSNWYSPDFTAMLSDSAFYYVIGQPQNRPQWDATSARAHTRETSTKLNRVGVGDASSASTNPPLYYLPQAAVYRAAHGLQPLSRLALMRVLAALLAGLTTLCVFAFLRELLPGSPLAWTVGALAAGLQPMFGFIASGVNNDGGLFLVTAALLLALARLLRRGLTPRRAAAVGALLAAGILTKTQALAYTPAVGLALLLAARKVPSGRLRGLAAAVGAGALPLAVYGVLGATVLDRPLFDRVNVVTAGATAGARPFLLSEQISYLWQEYLPRLPFMTDLMPGVQPYHLWFKQLVGRFGWLDYGYPGWAYPLALGIVLIVAAGAATHLWNHRAGLRARAGEIAVFALLALGLMVAIALVSYRSWLTGGSFEQGRYLLPLLPLAALVPALAVRAASPRFAPLAGVGIVLVTLSYSVFAQLLTVARFYG
jgi:hypothetical protein